MLDAAAALPQEPPPSTLAPIQVTGYARPANAALALEPRERQWLAQHRTLAVGIVPNDSLPLDIVGLGNEYEGISADYLELIGELLQVGWKVTAFDSAEAARAALVRGEIDLLPTVRDIDAGTALAMSPPYFYSRYEQVTAPGTGFNPRRAGLRLGFVEGHVRPDVLRRNYPNAELVKQASTFLGLSAVAAGTLDLLVDDGVSVAYLSDQYQLQSLRRGELESSASTAFHFATHSENTVLTRLLEKAIAALPVISRNDVRVRWSPTYDASLGRERVGLTDEEKAWIAAHPVVHYEAAADRMPFVFKEPAGRFDGLSVDVLNLIAERTGLAFVPLEAGEHARSPQKNGGPVEMLPVAVRGAPQPPGMVPTDAYFQGYWVIVAPPGAREYVRPESLANARVSYVAPNGVVERLKERVPSIELHPVANIAEAYEAVAQRRADVTVGNINTASYMIQHRYRDRLKVAGAIGDAPVDVAFAVPAAHRELLSIINKTLQGIRPEEMDRIRSNWMFLRFPASNWTPYYRWAYGAAAFLLVCLVAFWIWNLSLKKEVRRRMVAESTLQDELSFRNAMLNGMPHAVAVRDLDLRLMLCNEAFLGSYDVQRESIMGRRPIDSPLMGGSLEAAEQMQQRYRKVLSERKPLAEDVEIEVHGKRLNILHWAAPIALHKDGPPVALVTGGVDLTQRYQLMALVEAERANAVTANRAKSNFLATMSHEIRSPMNAVLGVLELLLRNGGLRTEDKESVELARRSALSLLGLIDDILDISKIEAGRLEVVERPTQLSSVVADIAGVFGHLARQRGLSLSVEIDPALAPMHSIDALRFRQIVNNLVSNAIKYTDKGGVTVRLLRGEVHAGRPDADGAATVSTAEPGKEPVILEVQDTGIGISAADVPHLFSPFFQAESAGPRTVGGTGLGLPIVQRLCSMMHAQIAVESKPGAGTCVRVSFQLPVAQGQAATDAAPAPQGAPILPRSERDRFTILVVDDHEANRMLLQRQLEHLGFRCATARDGSDGLRMWREEVFDLVITDCSMPVMDGYQMTEAIRREEARAGLPRCPVLGCTAHVGEDDVRRAIEVGMDECLTKPIGVDRLLDALTRHLDGEDYTIDSPKSGQPGTPDGPCFNPDSLAEFSGGRKAVEHELLEAMLRSNISDLGEIRAFIDGGALAAAASCAHKIRGAAQIISATAVVRACEALESYAGDGNLQGARDALEQLAHDLTALNEALTHYVRSDIDAKV